MPDDTHMDLRERVAALEQMLIERTAERDEALAQQAATAEVLQVINSSPGDLAPVFDTMLERAVRLCEAHTGHLFRFENGAFFRLASHGVSEDFDELFPLDRPVPLNQNSIPARMIATRSVVHVRDQREDESYWLHRDRDGVAAVEAGILTVLFVPLLKEGEVVGHFTMHRMEVRPFSEKQIALLENLAAQAVIAMENARLLTETREALERQTATAEVLQVINSSPGDLAPVFDAMLERANNLCETALGILWTFDGTHYRPGAIRGPQAFIDAIRDKPRTPGKGGTLFRHAVGELLVHIEDMAADSEVYDSNPTRRAFVDLGGARSSLSVALRKNGALLGALQVYRPQVRPFTDKQIALLQNFAAQAVVAMENARLLTETREALEQQTATAEVLQVINSSPGDLAPVFDAMLEKAMRLCGANLGTLYTYDGEFFRSVGHRGVSPGVEQFLRQPIRASLSSPSIYGGSFGQLVQGATLVHEADISTSEAYRRGAPLRKALVDLDGARTALWVALRRDDSLLGAFVIYRQEVRPFSDKQIALLQNFAAQAVIAIDNAQLLNEIRQRQAELRVTFDNMGDGVAMFDAELRLAAWNRNFQHILGLPDALLATRPTLADYIRHLATHGEYGEVDVEAEVRRLIEAVGRQYSTERTRPDGRVIEVRATPVPGGGIVLIYSDITERKRAEAEIRAARDAAQRALAELQTAQASLLHAQKMAALGQLTAGIAHEIKNPLNFVNNFAGLSVELLDELKEAAGPGIATLDEDARAEIDETIEMLTGNLEKIAEHGRRADGIVKSMLLHSRGGSGERQQVDLNALVDEALNLAYHGARAQDQNFNITMERDLAAGIAPIELVPQDVTRVFLNLIGNGFHAAHKRQKEADDSGFRPVLTVTTRDLGEAVEVRVRDNGTGILPEHRDKLFQPFFTTKPTGEGTGLGLSISYDIITQQHGGAIAVDSEVGEFTEFTVRLPRGKQSTKIGRAA